MVNKIQITLTSKAFILSTTQKEKRKKNTCKYIMIVLSEFLQRVNLKKKNETKIMRIFTDTLVIVDSL